MWLENHSHTLKGIQRGLEREALRVDSHGRLATTRCPEILGSVLTHKWISIDFSEALLEFITPTYNKIDHMLMVMRDIHRYTSRILGKERMWPLSMPCHVEHEQEIKIAQYGSSNIGRLKTLYREGLKNRYGALMQIISGVHYNFSLPISFWEEKYGKTDKNTISNGYFRIIRNYYRFGWVIPYLFGASPSVFSSFLKRKKSDISFETKKEMYYLPYATSLRMSDIGYTSKLQHTLGITFNKVHEYVARLKHAIATPSIEYKKIGLEKDGKLLQINTNILQIENELYVPIRPKRITYSEETTSDALLRDGIEYVEVRSLDINPFSPIGIDEQQIRFLDLFMVWCALAEIPEMNTDELLCAQIDWNRVILEGRKPGIKLGIKNKIARYPLQKIGKDLLQDLTCIAKIFDTVYGGNFYQQSCNELSKCFDYPELTFSAKILHSMMDRGINDTACSLAEKHYRSLKKEALSILSNEDFSAERNASLMRQQEIEETDKEPFSVFLEKKIALYD